MLSSAIKLDMKRHNILLHLILSDDLAKASVCDLTNFCCLERKCSKCEKLKDPLKSYFENWLQDITNIPIKYHQWEKIKEPYKDQLISKLKKVEVTKAKWEIFYELCELLEEFAFHIYNNVGQLSAFEKCKHTLNEEQLVVVVDFAENYTCMDFAEGQSSYYTGQSITIYHMVAIFLQQSVIKRDSVVVISPDLKHEASSVKACTMELFRHVKFFYPNIK